MRTFVPSLVIVLALLSACNERQPSKPAGSLSPDKVSAMVRSLTGTSLPLSATNVYGTTASMFTTIVDVRFECLNEELSSFLAASPVLKDELVQGKRTVVNTMGQKSWWQPDALQSVSGSEQSWSATNGTVRALLMSGPTAPPGRVTVYLSMTIE